MKRSAGDEVGPEQKRLATQQVGQAQGSARLKGIQKRKRSYADVWKKYTWSGTLEFQNRPRSQSNDQRQDVDIISCKIVDTINTDNWPKHLKMTTITSQDYLGLLSLDVSTLIAGLCIFSVDDDSDKMSYGAFMQYFSRPRYGCVLLECTSSYIQVMHLRSWLIEGEECVGYIKEYSNNDHTVKLLTDLGILSHATAYNILIKENARQKEELQQKDKMLVEQQKCHRKDVEMLETEKKEEKARMEKEKDEMQRERDVMQNQILERERTIYQKDSALAKIETSRSELKNQVLAKQATLDKLEKELECPICMDPLNMAVTLGCGHAQCYQCLETWVDHREPPSCPSCRNVLDSHLACSQVINNCVSIIKESK